jgi:hypothetical protein
MEVRSRKNLTRTHIKAHSTKSENKTPVKDNDYLAENRLNHEKSLNNEKYCTNCGIVYNKIDKYCGSCGLRRKIVIPKSKKNLF